MSETYKCERCSRIVSTAMHRINDEEVCGFCYWKDKAKSQVHVGTRQVHEAGTREIENRNFRNIENKPQILIDIKQFTDDKTSTMEILGAIRERHKISRGCFFKYLRQVHGASCT